MGGSRPFAQVPWLTDGDLSIFESGAILLHLGGLGEALMPADPRGRADAATWLFAAYSRNGEDRLEWKQWDGLFKSRLQRLEPVRPVARGWPGTSRSPTS